jgi:hypothetical protein
MKRILLLAAQRYQFDLRNRITPYPTGRKSPRAGFQALRARLLSFNPSGIQTNCFSFLPLFQPNYLL